MKKKLLAIKRILVLSLFLCLFLSSGGNAQGYARPAIYGIAKMTFRVSNFHVAREYYGDFLGFAEAFSYPSPLGQVISFKVNDRQFLEFIEDSAAKDKPRLVSVSFETDSIGQMRRFLQSEGIEVPDSAEIDGAGNPVFLIKDSSGIPVEFISFAPESFHRQSRGKFLSPRRISQRIHHVGLYTDKVVDDDPFYVGILGCREIWRFPGSREESVQMNYLQLPDCAEIIEHYSSSDINFSHPCFLSDDMQETIYTLKERTNAGTLAKPTVGKGNRWLLNLRNSDGTKIEFTEAHTIK